jgi:hypothetical protein
MDPVFVLWALILLILTPATSACSDNDTAQDKLTHAAERYALQQDPGWELQEAVDPRPDDAIAAHDRPPMDWYAEYVRSSYTEMVRLSGHDATVAESRAALEAVDFSFEQADVAGFDLALSGRSEVDESGPSVLLLSGGPGTLILLSYEVGIEELAAFAGTVEAANEDEWRASGGVTR